jgi:hypothetical protein
MHLTYNVQLGATNYQKASLSGQAVFVLLLLDISKGG